MKTKLVNIRGNVKEAVWVEKQGGWEAHWEVDGEPWNGHNVLWSFSFEPYTYLKESELSGDEWRKGGSIKIFRDKVCVMNEFHRDPATAAIRAHSMLAKCMGLDWEQVVPGRKIYYKDYPAVIDSLCDDGEILLRTADGSEFPLWAFQKEDENEAKNRDWTTTTRVHATDKGIWWWRRKEVEGEI